MPNDTQTPQAQRKIRRNYVAQYRKRAGIKNQALLGEAIGKGQTTISRIEAHSIPMTSDNEIAIAEALKLNDPSLLYVHPDRPNLNARATELPDWEVEELAEIIDIRKRRYSGKK